MEEYAPHRLFFSAQEIVDVSAFLAWLILVVDLGPFRSTSEFAYVNAFGWILFAVSLTRLCIVRRSRSLIREAGFEGTRGARLREVVYCAQQLLFQDVPAIILVGFVGARLAVKAEWGFVWPIVTMGTLCVSEITFIKFGRALSRAKVWSEGDPVSPTFLFAFVPPGSQSSSEPNPEVQGNSSWIRVDLFDDSDDGSIGDINLLLGGRWF